MATDAHGEVIKIGDELFVRCKVIETFTVESHRNVRCVPMGLELPRGEKLPVIFVRGRQCVRQATLDRLEPAVIAEQVLRRLAHEYGWDAEQIRHAQAVWQSSQPAPASPGPAPEQTSVLPA